MDATWRAVVSILLIVGTAFFVMAEYSLVGCRKAKMESLAKRGNKTARLVANALGHISFYVAGTQVAITMFSIGIGSVTEPWITEWLSDLFGKDVNRSISFIIALVFVTYVTVVIGELVPKYVTLFKPDRVAILTIRPLVFFVTLLKPMIWVIQRSGAIAVLPFGINLSKIGTNAMPKEELLLLLKAGTTEGVLDEVHAEILSRAVQLDKLMAKDIMVHRLDIQWIHANTPTNQILERFAEVPHSRVPVCRGDIDDVVGIVYLHHIVKGLRDPSFTLEKAIIPPELVPENLTLDRIVLRMREARTQMLIVMDEYGGTSGLITLEDVVEEVFGDLEDRLESERSPIEIHPSGRISARADVRFDEIVAKLGVELEDVPTDTLANLLVTELERVPKLGDSVETSIGVMRIENMSRNRITRVSLQLSSDWQEYAKAALEERGT